MLMGQWINFLIKASIVTVDSWQPTPIPTQIEQDDLKRLITSASEFVKDKNFTPDLDWIQPLAKAEYAIWQNTVQDLSDNELINIIKLLTTLETQHNWDLGEKSPVIAVFKTYKKKSGLNRELVQWVKANSDNQYLPFGPLI
jgi:hypothetical protein